MYIYIYPHKISVEPNFVKLLDQQFPQKAVPSPKASAASTASASADLGEQLAAARESEARWAKARGWDVASIHGYRLENHRKMEVYPLVN